MAEARRRRVARGRFRRTAETRHRAAARAHRRSIPVATDGRRQRSTRLSKFAFTLMFLVSAMLVAATLAAPAHAQFPALRPPNVTDGNWNELCAQASAAGYQPGYHRGAQCIWLPN